MDTANTPQRVIIYTRVSTCDQAESGVSLAAQLGQCQAYASLYGLEVVEAVEDAGASAKSLQRPGWARVEELLASRRADGVVVMKLDRLTRSTVDLGTLLARHFTRGVALHAVAEKVDTSSAAGLLVLDILTSVSQWERRAISERTSVALQHKRSRGERVGSVPYGYRDVDGYLVEDDEEQVAIRMIEGLRTARMSVRGIAHYLNTEGVQARGRRWHATTIARLLKRPPVVLRGA